uniref:Uncharacterized protein n=1 Tax=Arundo donax TaxID=35708 RepID=A0A0A9H6N5_ARUDO
MTGRGDSPVVQTRWWDKEPVCHVKSQMRMVNLIKLGLHIDDMGVLHKGMSVMREGPGGCRSHHHDSRPYRGEAPAAAKD